MDKTDITEVAGLEHMDLKELEIKYQVAELFLYKKLVQERFMAEKWEEEKPTCTIEEITDDQDSANTPWYYRLIPCCASTPRPKAKKPKNKKNSTGGLFGRVRKFFCRRSPEIK